MTRDETMILITKIRSYYPNWTPKVSPKDLVENWFEVLRKYEFKIILDMLGKYIEKDDQGFAPPVSKLIPKQMNGFTGRLYTHEDFVEMEREAIKLVMEVEA